MVNNDYGITLLPLVSVADKITGFPSSEERAKRNTKRIGIFSELMVIARFAEAGFLVSVPFGDSAPYDLIVDDRKGSISRIQVKTGRLRKNVVLFSCQSSHWHRGGPPTRYEGLIDAFAVYCREVEEMYLVPIGAPPARRQVATLRTTQPKIVNQWGFHRATDYRFDTRNPALPRRGASPRGAAGED